MRLNGGSNRHVLEELKKNRKKSLIVARLCTGGRNPKWEYFVSTVRELPLEGGDTRVLRLTGWERARGQFQRKEYSLQYLSSNSGRKGLVRWDKRFQPIPISNLIDSNRSEIVSG
jgi:hypothetical protein